MTNQELYNYARKALPRCLDLMTQVRVNFANDAVKHCSTKQEIKAYAMKFLGHK